MKKCARASLSYALLTFLIMPLKLNQPYQKLNSLLINGYRFAVYVVWDGDSEEM